FGEPLATSTTKSLCTAGYSNSLANDAQFSRNLHYFTGATIRQPQMLGTAWTPALSLYSERRGEYLAYLRSTFVGSDVSASREISEGIPLRLAYTFEYGHTE